MRLDTIDLIKNLSDAFGPSGREKTVATLIQEQLEGIDTSIDRVGNLIAHIPSNNGMQTKTMFCAHMDEPGFIVRDVDGDGKIWLKFMGGVPTQRISGRIGTIEGKINCIFSAKPIHTLSGDERSKPTSADKIYAEIGAIQSDDAAAFAKLGYYGAFAPSFGEIGHYIKGKALGSRSSCALLIELARKVFENNIPHDDLYFVFSTFGEIGNMGAEVATNVIDPTKAIVVDGFYAFDTPDVPEESKICCLGQGAVILRGDGKTLFNKELVEKTMADAKANGIEYQFVMRQAQTGEGCVVQRALQGRVCASVCLPVRYKKSASEMISMNDYKAVSSILASMI